MAKSKEAVKAAQARYEAKGAVKAVKRKAGLTPCFFCKFLSESL